MTEWFLWIAVPNAVTLSTTIYSAKRFWPVTEHHDAVLHFYGPESEGHRKLCWQIQLRRDWIVAGYATPSLAYTWWTLHRLHWWFFQLPMLVFIIFVTIFTVRIIVRAARCEYSHPTYE